MVSSSKGKRSPHYQLQQESISVLKHIYADPHCYQSDAVYQKILTASINLARIASSTSKSKISLQDILSNNLTLAGMLNQIDMAIHFSYVVGCLGHSNIPQATIIQQGLMSSVGMLKSQSIFWSGLLRPCQKPPPLTLKALSCLCNLASRKLTLETEAMLHDIMKYARQTNCDTLLAESLFSYIRGLILNELEPKLDINRPLADLCTQLGSKSVPKQLLKYFGNIFKIYAQLLYHPSLSEYVPHDTPLLNLIITNSLYGGFESPYQLVLGLFAALVEGGRINQFVTEFSLDLKHPRNGNEQFLGDLVTINSYYCDVSSQLKHNSKADGVLQSVRRFLKNIENESATFIANRLLNRIQEAKIALMHDDNIPLSLCSHCEIQQQILEDPNHIKVTKGKYIYYTWSSCYGVVSSMLNDRDCTPTKFKTIVEYWVPKMTNFDKFTTEYWRQLLKKCLSLSGNSKKKKDQLNTKLNFNENSSLMNPDHDNLAQVSASRRFSTSSKRQPEYYKRLYLIESLLKLPKASEFLFDKAVLQLLKRCQPLDSRQVVPLLNVLDILAQTYFQMDKQRQKAFTETTMFVCSLAKVDLQHFGSLFRLIETNNRFRTDLRLQLEAACFTEELLSRVPAIFQALTTCMGNVTDRTQLIEVVDFVHEARRYFQAHCKEQLINELLGHYETVILGDRIENYVTLLTTHLLNESYTYNFGFLIAVLGKSITFQASQIRYPSKEDFSFETEVEAVSQCLIKIRRKLRDFASLICSADQSSSPNEETLPQAMAHCRTLLKVISLIGSSLGSLEGQLKQKILKFLTQLNCTNIRLQLAVGKMLGYISEQNYIDIINHSNGFPDPAPEQQSALAVFEGYKQVEDVSSRILKIVYLLRQSKFITNYKQTVSYLTRFVWELSSSFNEKKIVEDTKSLLYFPSYSNTIKGYDERQLAFGLLAILLLRILTQLLNAGQISEMRSILRMSSVFIVRSGHIKDLLPVIQCLVHRKEITLSLRLMDSFKPFCTLADQKSYQRLDRLICANRRSSAVMSDQSIHKLAVSAFGINSSCSFSQCLLEIIVFHLGTINQLPYHCQYLIKAQIHPNLSGISKLSYWIETLSRLLPKIAIEPSSVQIQPIIADCLTYLVELCHQSYRHARCLESAMGAYYFNHLKNSYQQNQTLLRAAISMLDFHADFKKMSRSFEEFKISEGDFKQQIHKINKTYGQFVREARSRLEEKVAILMGRNQVLHCIHNKAYTKQKQRNIDDQQQNCSKTNKLKRILLDDIEDIQTHSQNRKQLIRPQFGRQSNESWCTLGLSLVYSCGEYLYCINASSCTLFTTRVQLSLFMDSYDILENLIKSSHQLLKDKNISVSEWWKSRERVNRQIGKIAGSIEIGLLDYPGTQVTQYITNFPQPKQTSPENSYFSRFKDEGFSKYKIQQKPETEYNSTFRGINKHQQTILRKFVGATTQSAKEHLHNYCDNNGISLSEAQQYISQSPFHQEPNLLVVLPAHLNHLPIESIPLCRRYSGVYRIPSISYLLLHPTVPPPYDLEKVTYIVNSNNDLNETEETFYRMKQDYQSWTGLVGVRPTMDQYCSALEASVFLYMGHGAGTSHLHQRSLATKPVKSLLLLFGCSSVNMSSNGMQSHGLPFQWLNSGCPGILGCLWDVTDKDVDRLTEKLFQKSRRIVEDVDLDTLMGVLLSYMACQAMFGEPLEFIVNLWFNQCESNAQPM